MEIENLNSYETEATEIFLCDELSILDYIKEKTDDSKTKIHLPPGLMPEEITLVNEFVTKLKKGRRRR